jgi:hypothetical protein
MKKIFIALVTLSSFFSNAQVATKLDIADTRNDNEAPNFYTKGIRADFKHRVNLSIPGVGNYGTTLSINPWTNLDNSGNKVHQLHFNDGGLFYRNANPLDATWGTWRQLLLTNANGSLDFNGTIFAGPGSSPEGQNILSGRYSNGTTSNWGSLWSSSASFMGFGVRANTASPGGWVSSNPIAIAKSAITTDYFGFHMYGTTNAQSIAEGTAVTLSEYFTVRESGNVGIGVGNPAAKLEVNGSISSSMGSGAKFTLFDNNSTRNNRIELYADANGANILSTYSTGGSKAINFNSASTTVMKIADNGNVGIGTIDPLYKLDIRGESYSQGHTIQAYSPTLTLKRNTTTGGYVQGIQTQQQDGTNNWFFGNHSTSDFRISKGDFSAPKLIVTDTGNVGVGIVNPSTKLEVYNTAGQGHLTLLGNDDSSQELSRISLDYKIQGVDHVIGRISSFYQTQTNNGSGGLRFFSRYQGSLNEAMRLDSNGNIGIGTTSPTAKLEVVGKSSFTDNMKVNAKIEAKEIKVTLTPTADFVFEEDYNLPKLEEVEKHIKEKKHLPEIASAKQMEKEGVNVGEFQIKLLQKIEELTLYTIEQNKKIEAQNKQILEQNQRIEKLEKKIKS